MTQNVKDKHLKIYFQFFHKIRLWDGHQTEQIS